MWKWISLLAYDLYIEIGGLIENHPHRAHYGKVGFSKFSYALMFPSHRHPPGPLTPYGGKLETSTGNANVCHFKNRTLS